MNTGLRYNSVTGKIEEKVGGSVVRTLDDPITNYVDTVPNTDNTKSFGSSSAYFKDFYIKGSFKDGINSKTLAEILAGGYTDEMAQDAVGGILANTSNVQFVYDDGTPKITASVDLSGKEAILIHQIVATLPAVAGAKCRVRVPMAGTITSAIITGDISGSAVVDIWKDTTANYPPSVADTITASAKPTLSTQSLVTDSTLTGWTKTLTTGDWLVFSVDSCDVLSDIQVTLIYTRN